MDKKKIFKISSIILFSIGVFIMFSMSFIKSYDYWWHLKAGEYMVTNKTIPYTDVFSWFGIENNLQWISHEWLTEVLLYSIFNVAKELTPYIFIFVTLMTLILFILITNMKGFLKNNKLSFLWVSIGVFIITPVLAARPHMISFILLAITIWALYDLKKNEKSKKIWLLPIVSILWVNFHGGSANLPYVLSVMFIITGLFEFKIGKLVGSKLNKLQIKKYGISSILSMICTAINPHGIKMIFYPYVNMGDSYMLNMISEWRCPDLKIVYDLPIFILIFAVIAVLFLSSKDIDFTDCAISGAFIYLTFKSIRFSVLLYIVASYIVFKYINECKKESVNTIINIFLILVGVFSIIISIPTIPTNTEEAKNKVVYLLPNKAIEIIKKENPKRIYNNYDFGGYLIYNDIKVFWDGRADMYSNNILEEADKFADLKNDTLEVIDKHKFDLYVLYEKDILSQYFDNINDLYDEDKFEVLYRDKGIVIYKPQPL